MKKIRSKNIEICVAFAFILLSSGLINFASADNASSTEKSSVGKNFYRNKDRITDKKAEMEQKILKMKETKGPFGTRLEGRKTRFGTSTFSTSTVGFGAYASSTASFRKRELEKIKKEERKINERFDNNVKRLDNFYRRISDKISKFEKKGVDITETKVLLDIAKSKIDIAKSDVGDLGKAINDGIGNQNGKDYFASIKNLSIKAKNSIKDAQEALSSVIKSLKPGFNKNKSSSSSTSSSSVSSVATSSSSVSSSADSSSTSSSISSSSSSL